MEILKNSGQEQERIDNTLRMILMEFFLIQLLKLNDHAKGKVRDPN